MKIENYDNKSVIMILELALIVCVLAGLCIKCNGCHHFFIAIVVLFKVIF